MLNINNIISALIATHFFGSNTEQHDEKVKKAGFARLLLYFLLIIAIIPIFVKSYKVGTFQNLLFISPLKSPINDSIIKEPIDSIDVCFVNCLSSDTTNFNAVKNAIDREYRKKQSKYIVEYGGGNSSGIVTVFSPGKPNNGPEYTFYSPNAECDFFEELKIDDTCNTPFLFPPFYVGDIAITPPITASATIEDYKKYKNDSAKCQKAAEDLYDLFCRTTQNVKRLYVTEYFGNQIPSFLPFVLDPASEFVETQNDSVYYYYKWEPILTNDPVGYHFKEYNGATYPRSVMSTNLKGDLGQLGFFTAADISQAFYNIDFFTRNPVRSIEFLFDVPIQLSDDIYPVPDIRTFRGFGYYDNSKIEKIKEMGGVEFHVKFPSLESQQLIRSIIISTIFTSVIALFAKNLYYYIRRIDWNLAHGIKRKNRKCKNKWYVLYGLILAVLLFLVYYYSLRIMTEKPFTISSENLTKDCIVSIVAILLFVVIWRFVHIKSFKKEFPIDKSSQN